MRESWVRVYTEASGASQGGPDLEQTGRSGPVVVRLTGRHLAIRTPYWGTP